MSSPPIARGPLKRDIRVVRIASMRSFGIARAFSISHAARGIVEEDPDDFSSVHAASIPLTPVPLPRASYRSRMARINLTVNGRAQSVDLDESTPLLYVLSDELALNGPKFGCGLGQCGACTVIVKGQAIRSCVTPVKTVAGAEITTLDGLGTPETASPSLRVYMSRPRSVASA